MTTASSTPVRATARLQFHRDFPIDRGTELVPYLQRLGISHVYASPLLTARPGSTHGYDIVDHNEINPELGGEEALRRLVAALRAHGMGLILDIVPNHMGVGGADNHWWLDVLEWGRASRYAEFFDIDWEPPDPALRGKMLAPFLGAAYGEVLAGGDIRLRFDPADGRFFASVYDAHRFPIAPRDYPLVLRAAGGALDDLVGGFAEAGAGGREGTRKRAESGREQLRAAHATRKDDFERGLAAFAPDTDGSRDRLHKLLERQAYRLAWWRAAADEINWRRFFDINGLAGVRVERPEVFEATHKTVFRLYAEGLIDGVRIDHVDGLADPRGYCRKLRRRLDAEHLARPAGLQAERPILWIEKILFAHEHLATDWLTDGTTGYDFMNEVAAVLHDPEGEATLTALWVAQTGRPPAFETEAQAARRQILRVALSSELNATTALLHRIMRRDLATRDWTPTAIRRALVELLVHFHTYRVYAGPGGASETDVRDVAWAMAGARKTVRTADKGLLELIGTLLLGEGLRQIPAGPQRQERLRAMVRFQQLSAPTAAKSVEDTAFYRYGRLLSRNEVGSEPTQWALTVAGYHATSTERRRRFPRALLATATHDHKRGEDTRMRLAVLSEIPDEWEAALARWTRLNAPLKREIDGGAAPDMADELMLYQMLVAAWPLDLDPANRTGLEEYRARMGGWLEKALREAKRHSEWAAPNADYEAACQEFLRHCLDADRSAPVAREISAFAMRIAPAGAVNSLSQTLLKLTSPGVPDTYQGAEYWDFSLVDPDNRRPVDWTARAAALGAQVPPAALLAAWHDGRIKQALVARALGLRVRFPRLFSEGTYQKLRTEGSRADHVIAFARIHEGHAIVAVATRLPARLLPDAATGGCIPLVSPVEWDATTIVLPRNLLGRRMTDVLGETREATLLSGGSTGRLRVSELLAAFPVGLLEAG